MKIRLLFSATMMASVFALASQAHAGNCDVKGGDALHRLASKEDCLNDRLDRKIGKYQRNRALQREKVEQLRDRVSNAPEYEKERLRNKLDDKIDKATGRKKLDEKINKFNEKRAGRVERFQQMKEQQQQDIQDLKAARQRTRDNVNGLLRGGL